MSKLFHAMDPSTDKLDPDLIKILLLDVLEQKIYEKSNKNACIRSSLLLMDGNVENTHRENQCNIKKCKLLLHVEGLLCGVQGCVLLNISKK